MRELIIKSLDMIVWIVAGLIALGGVIVGVMALGQGEVAGLGIIIGGLLYAVVFAGMFFLMIGVYTNTKRTAEAIEKLAAR
ncbi:MAG: hypothetical protein IH625_12860 [Rhodobacteraceae bacterium]|jgi:hypothetical protein|nr:hypothetical protein [Paracoccaceae bacterium]